MLLAAGDAGGDSDLTGDFSSSGDSGEDSEFEILSETACTGDSLSASSYVAESTVAA